MYDQDKQIDLLVIACSAGGVMLLMELLQELKSDISFAILVIIHRNDKFHSTLEEMVQQKCRLRAKEAEEKEKLTPGIIYFVPGGYHLLIETDKTVALDVSEPVNYCRPSIDVSLQSAAEVFQDKLVAILLSGANKDGAEGLRAVHRYGGVTLVQNPEFAEVDVMPKAAIETNSVTAVLSDAQLKEYCRKLV
ncbi:chemotaxis protein CheB [Olivibacter sp. SDN3]|uniref:chemotaxis protein CheB n=1 Tax=Olivibacter sp. SDN3 TaxID=2764720 RepID=UPI001650E6E0|nr:chemotaxis protein CheB [Olivibacter sp. SDN3]QNL49169.1 chemotaxis protein CheB [Olivibacter sp. SDN3]